MSEMDHNEVGVTDKGALLLEGGGCVDGGAEERPAPAQAASTPPSRKDEVRARTLRSNMRNFMYRLHLRVCGHPGCFVEPLGPVADPELPRRPHHAWPSRASQAAQFGQGAGHSPDTRAGGESAPEAKAQAPARGRQAPGGAGAGVGAEDAFIDDFGDVDCPQTAGAPPQVEGEVFDPLGDLCTLPEFAKHIPKQYRTTSGVLSVFQLRQRHVFQKTDDRAELKQQQPMLRALEQLLEQKRVADQSVPEARRDTDPEYCNIVDLCHWASVTQASVFTSTTHSSTDLRSVPPLPLLLSAI